MLCGVVRSFIWCGGINALFIEFFASVLVVTKISKNHQSLIEALITGPAFIGLAAYSLVSKHSSKLTMTQSPCDNVHFHSGSAPICRSIHFFHPIHSHKLCRLLLCAFNALIHQFCFWRFWIFRALLSMIYWLEWLHRFLLRPFCIWFKNRWHCFDIVMSWDSYYLDRIMR